MADCLNLCVYVFQCKLELVDIGKPVDHATAFGRIAFACPKGEVSYWNMKSSIITFSAILMFYI